MTIDYERFVREYYPDATTTKQRDIERFIDNLSELIGDTPIDKALANQTVLCRAFFLQENCGISRPHYQKIKDYLLNVAAMYRVDIEIPTRDIVVASQSHIEYFRGLDELLEFIDDVGSDRLAEYNPTQDLVIVKSICVLGWYGFAPSEIAELRKSELHLVGYDAYSIMRSGKEIVLRGAAFAPLYYLYDLETYNALPRGKTMTFTGDPDYLFRPTINSGKLVGNSIVQIIRRFNTQIAASFRPQTILFRNLHKNALFLEVYNDESDRPLLVKISSIMGCNQNYALSYKEQYLRFVEALEGGII